MLLVLNNFIKKRLTTKSNEFQTETRRGHASRPYNSAGRHLCPNLFGKLCVWWHHCASVVFSSDYQGLIQHLSVIFFATRSLSGSYADHVRCFLPCRRQAGGGSADLDPQQSIELRKGCVHVGA